MLAVNVAGTILCSREAVRRMSTRRGGSGGAIVNNKTNHGRHVGAEIDSYSWYELNRHFNVGGGIGYFGGGQFLTNVTTSHSYRTYYIALNFKDNGKR